MHAITVSLTVYEIFNVKVGAYSVTLTTGLVVVQDY